MGSLIGLQLEDILAIEPGRSLGDFEGRVASQHVGEGALAGSVGTHDRVDLTRVDRQVHALEDLLVLDRGVKIFDFKHWHVRGVSHGFPVVPP